MTKLGPDTDGIDHINIYSKSRTELGRLLSNFAYSPIVLPEDGSFSSIEGYWYWLLCDSPSRDRLRTLFGFGAKEMGRHLQSPDWPSSVDLESFKVKIEKALFKKAESSPLIQGLLSRNRLPFSHYYVYNEKIIKVKDCEWILEIWNKISIFYKNKEAS